MKLGSTVEYDGRPLSVWSEGPDRGTWWLSDGTEFYLWDKGVITHAKGWRETTRAVKARLDSYRQMWGVASLHHGEERVRIQYHSDLKCPGIGGLVTDVKPLRMPGSRYLDPGILCQKCDKE
jgi:hypothetical protein